LNAVRTTTEPYWDLVDQSLEEAAFYWKRWEADLQSLTRNLDEVGSWTEDRLAGALDGVRVAGGRVVEVTQAALEGEDLAARTVAAHVLAARTSEPAREALAAAVREAAGEPLQAMARGIETAALDGTFAPVTAALAGGGPEHAAALCRIKAFRRAAPGKEAMAALESNVPRLQAQVLRALGFSGDEPFVARYVSWGLKSESAQVRRAAIAAGIRRRDAGAWDAAIELIGQRHPDCAPFLSCVAALGSPEERELVLASLREPALQQAALFALGYIGTPRAIEISLAGMRDAKLARAAGEAYCAITGAELARDHLAAPDPAESPSPPPLEDDDLEADLVPKPHELWPLPDLTAVQRHWQGVRGNFGADVRHFRGRPVDLETLLAALESGSMLRRADLALELAVRTGGKYDLEPRAFAQAQRTLMRAGRARLAAPAAR
jgi:uncharacterized protein (TIGR02270 family)